MSNLQDLADRGYQVIQELGHNRPSGRVTYLATAVSTQQLVAIKQFQFATADSNWSDYEAINREIQLLQQLNSPSIPRYLDSFETPTAFYLVQEYKQAPSLSQSHPFTAPEIKQIALCVLEILVYLQQQVPAVIHRDIKPENILLDRQEDFKVYLVDFGLARIGSGEVAISSAVKGTLGFMPPEQLFNRQLTKASDLYALGATLICLLTNTKSTEIGNLIDEAYGIKFKQLVPQLSPQFMRWLEKMVAPSVKHRYPTASTALEALKSIDVNRVASPLKFLVPPIQPPKLVTATLLAAIAFAIAISTPGLIKQGRVRHLLETKQCEGCNLSGVNLGNANLGNASLQGADLGSANLAAANLGNANLQGANLQGANLGSANLATANLQGANLQGANLQRANLGCAATNLNRTEPEDGSNLSLSMGADFRLNIDANEQGANLSINPGGDVSVQLGADEQGGNLSINLGGDLSFNMDANEQGAGLSLKMNAHLVEEGAIAKNIGCANLQGANLQGATMPDGTMHH